MHLTVVGGPAQQILRPSDLDDPALHSAMQQEAMFGERPVFDRTQGMHASANGGSSVPETLTLVLSFGAA